MKNLKRFLNEYKTANIVLVCSIILVCYFSSKIGKNLTCRYLRSLPKDALMGDNNSRRVYTLEEYVVEKNLEYCFEYKGEL